MFKINFNSLNQPLQASFGQDNLNKPVFSNNENEQQLHSHFTNGNQVEYGSIQQENFYSQILNLVNTIRMNYNPVYYDTKENWDAQVDLIAQHKAIYIYSNYTYIEDQDNNRYPVPAIKIGDGTSYLIDMPFVDEGTLRMLIEHINNTNIHVSSEDRIFWNNKVSSFIDDEDDEMLILSKNLFKLEN